VLFVRFVVVHCCYCSVMFYDVIVIPFVVVNSIDSISLLFPFYIVVVVVVVRYCC